MPLTVVADDRAALAVIAAWEIARTERAGAGVPDDVAWKRAADVVRLEANPGDLIPLDMAARMDSARYGSVWELSIRGARAPEAELASGDVEAESEVDGIEIRHITRQAAVVVTDFVTALGGARVTGDRVRGPSVELAEVGFAPHRCAQIVPAPGKSVTIAFDRAALGRELVGYVGLADVFTRRDVREPGRLVVAIDGKEVANVTVGDDDGWVRFAAKTTPGPATVTFTATAVGAGARDRLICFAAEARR